MGQRETHLFYNRKFSDTYKRKEMIQLVKAKLVQDRKGTQSP